jgi:hypothetical protein
MSRRRPGLPGPILGLLLIAIVIPAVSCVLVAGPLWLPLLLVALPTAYFLLWYHHRAPGSCIRCGYDLTGNTTGVCPECAGTATSPRHGDAIGAASTFRRRAPPARAASTRSRAPVLGGQPPT